MAMIYISQTGHASPTGTEAQPYSISWLNTNASAGNTYVLMGDFTSSIVPPASGAPGSPITYAAHPTLGASITRSSARSAVIFSSPRQYIELDGIVLNTGLSGSAAPIVSLAAGDYSGLKVRRCQLTATVRDSAVNHIAGTAGIYGADIEFCQNKFDDSFYDSVALVQAAAGDITGLVVYGNEWTSNGRHAFLLNASAAAGVLSNVVIRNNLIDGTGIDKGGTWNAAWSNGAGIFLMRTTLSVGATATNVCVCSNVLRNVQGKGIEIDCVSGLSINDNNLRDISRGINGQAIGLYGCNAFQVKRNHIEDVFSALTGFDGHGIDIDVMRDSVTDAPHHCYDGEIAGNNIRNAKAAQDSPGVNLVSAVNVHVHHNLIVDTRHGILMTFYSIAAGAPHCEDNNVHNNTVVGLSQTDSESGIRYAYAPTLQAAAVNSNLVRNNLFVNLGAALVIQALAPDAATITAPEYNAFVQCGQNYVNLDDAGGFNNNTANDVVSAPQLAQSYAPLSGSPLLTDGADLGYMRDLEGKQSKGHIGCYGAARILER
jgi:hypothetical protein